MGAFGDVAETGLAPSPCRFVRRRWRRRARSEAKVGKWIVTNLVGGRCRSEGSIFRSLDETWDMDDVTSIAWRGDRPRRIEMNQWIARLDRRVRPGRGIVFPGRIAGRRERGADIDRLHPHRLGHAHADQGDGGVSRGIRACRMHDPPGGGTRSNSAVRWRPKQHHAHRRSAGIMPNPHGDLKSAGVEQRETPGIHHRHVHTLTANRPFDRPASIRRGIAGRNDHQTRDREVRSRARLHPTRPTVRTQGPDRRPTSTTDPGDGGPRSPLGSTKASQTVEE